LPATVLRADHEQVLLDAGEHGVDVARRFAGPREPYDGIELVYRPIGLHAGFVFGHAPAPEEAGRTVVAGLRVDLHRTAPPVIDGSNAASYAPSASTKIFFSGIASRSRSSIAFVVCSISSTTAPAEADLQRDHDGVRPRCIDRN
jgi:hypothetical protein